MNELQVFNFDNNEVRTILVNEEPYFIANDVARILGYKNPSKATKDHCRKPIKTWGNDSLGRRQEYKVIPESDVYRLIVKSKLAQAEKFEEWVMDEVLPTIRKHGAYMTPEKIEEVLTNPDTIIQLATQLKLEQQEKQILQQQIAEYEPKISYLDMILS